MLLSRALTYMLHVPRLPKLSNFFVAIPLPQGLTILITFQYKFSAKRSTLLQLIQTRLQFNTCEQDNVCLTLPITCKPCWPPPPVRTTRYETNKVSMRQTTTPPLSGVHYTCSLLSTTTAIINVQITYYFPTPLKANNTTNSAKHSFTATMQTNQIARAFE